MVIKLLASARNSPTAPRAAGLLFSLSLVGEALLNSHMFAYRQDGVENRDKIYTQARRFF